MIWCDCPKSAGDFQVMMRCVIILIYRIIRLDAAPPNKSWRNQVCSKLRTRASVWWHKRRCTADLVDPSRKTKERTFKLPFRKHGPPKNWWIFSTLATQFWSRKTIDSKPWDGVGCYFFRTNLSDVWKVLMNWQQTFGSTFQISVVFMQKNLGLWSFGQLFNLNLSTWIICGDDRPRCCTSRWTPRKTP